MTARVRADQLLVDRGLAESRTKAQALVLAGRVFSGEQRVEKAGDKVAVDAELTVRGDLHPWVSRGGLKLQGALDDFGLDPKGMLAVDVGASTGGFTDVLLSRGAAEVYAVDVGHGQLHVRLRSDPRVRVFERTNARTLTPAVLGLPGPVVDLVVVDASFIGLDKLLPAIASLLRSSGQLVALVKPQFQLARGDVGPGGVVRDDGLRAKACDVVAEAARALGFEVHRVVDCTIAGPAGNRELFLHATLSAEGFSRAASRQPAVHEGDGAMEPQGGQARGAHRPRGVRRR